MSDKTEAEHEERTINIKLSLITEVPNETHISILYTTYTLKWFPIELI